MNDIDRRALAAAQRRHLRFFLMKSFETLHPGQPPLGSAWYLDALCHRLEEVKAGAIRRVVITVPPRHLKSVTCSVAFVAWLLGHDPSLKVMVASYSQDLARLHADHCRIVMETAWYKALFPATRISDRGNRALELVTTKGGVRKAVSVGGSITGFGADLIIVDDCMKADEVRSQAARDEVKGWFGNTLFTRLNDKEHGRIVSIQQRLHEDDLPAMLLERGYEHLNLPAIAEREQRFALGHGRVHDRKVGDLLNPARENQAVLDQIRRELGPVAFSAQYQQEPTVPEGNLLRLEWFGTYETRPERHMFLKVIQSWDTGMTDAPSSDYSVGMTWGFRGTQWYLLNIVRERLAFPDLKRAIIAQWRAWKADKVLIEKAGSGHALWPEFRASGPFLPIMISANASKEERLVGCLAEIEAGRLVLPSDAPWVEALRSELRSFPNGRYDDQVDSLTQFVAWQRRHWKYVLSDEDELSGRTRDLVGMRKRPF